MPPTAPAGMPRATALNAVLEIPENVADDAGNSTAV
ncbi:hypothetical protein JOM49_005138 [Amycolatopsis magusensis]|uniref:Uncharacterized protein n=1 Tax=Amycolatopsis magusensis TaxID=882444 RepID=A0ABS4PW10_9PSEU|nr:hypothetical protein [Amycolatopsis magusensis]